MKQGHHGASSERRIHRSSLSTSWLLKSVTCVVTLAVCAGVAEWARADYIFMDKVYQRHWGGLGGSYRRFSYVDAHEYPTPPETFPEPYGGWYDGVQHPTSNPHVGYSYAFPMSTNPAYAGPAALAVDSIEEAIFKEGPNDPDPYVFRSNPEPTTERPISFLSLPGTQTAGSANNTYVVVGIQGKAIDPNGLGNDILISNLYQEEDAHVYGSTRTGNPATFGPSDFLFMDTVAVSEDTEFNLADWFTEPVTAIKIEGADLEGESFGLDLSRVMVSRDSIIQIIPEPASVVLLAVGGLALLFVRRRRRKR